MVGWGHRKCSVPRTTNGFQRLAGWAGIMQEARKDAIKYQDRGCWCGFGLVAPRLSSNHVLGIHRRLCVSVFHFTCFKHRTADTRRMRSESSLAHRISRYEVVSVSKPLSSSICLCRPATSRMYRESDRTWASLKAAGRWLSSSSVKHCSIVPLVPPARSGPAGCNMKATFWLGCGLVVMQSGAAMWVQQTLALLSRPLALSSLSFFAKV